MATTNNIGIVAPVAKVTWDSETTYQQLNIVLHGSESYIAKAGSTGIEPGVTSGWENSWQLLATGVGIEKITSGTPVTSIDITLTPVTVTMTDGSTFTFSSTSKNGEVSESDLNSAVSQLQETIAANKAETDTALNDKANINGLYMGLVAGGAYQLLSDDGTEQLAAFVKRTTAGTESISSGEATIKKIIGKSYVFNQLLDRSQFPASSTVNGITFTNNGDGTITASGTATETATYTVCPTSYQPTHPKKGRTYLLCGTPDAGSGSTFGMYYQGGTGDFGGGYVFARESDQNRGDVVIFVRSGVTANNLVFAPQFVDLSLMFGFGNEPQTKAEYQALFPAVYGYEEGMFLSPLPQAIKTVGFNLLDSNTVLPAAGFTKQTDGSFYAPTPSSVSGKTAWQNDCGYSGQVYVSGKIRTVSASSGVCLRFLYTDGTSSDITVSSPSTSWQSLDSGNLSSANKTVFQIVFVEEGSTATYFMDLCINLSWSGGKNGEYKPYTENNLNLTVQAYFPEGVKSAGAMTDTVDYTLRRATAVVGVKTFDGTESFTLNTNLSGVNRFVYSASDSVTDNSNCFITCNRFAANTISAMNAAFTTNGIGLFNNAFWFYANPNDFPDVESFKTYLAQQYAAGTPVVCYYGLETQTVTEIPDTTNNTYPCDDFGTEQWIEPFTASIPVPVTAQILYLRNLVDTIRTLPQTYISAQGMQTLVSALNTALADVGTFSMAYNESTQTWVFTFSAKE